MTRLKILYTSVALLVGIVVMVNLLAHEFRFRIDFSQGKQYTLSKATRDILSGLDEPVTVRAYFSENLPAHIQKARTDFQDMLVEFASRSRGRVMFEFINPNADDAKEQEVAQKGIRPVMINVREKDQMKQQRAYLGATVDYGEKQEVIPFIQPGAAMEYALATAIKKLTIDEKPKVGFLQGHGEPGIFEMAQLEQQLDILYETETVAFTDSTSVPADVNTMVIVRPTDSIPAAHFAKLDTFLGRGGRMVVAFNRVEGNLQSGQGTAVNTALESWLETKGLAVDAQLVIDAQCATIPVQQQQGFFMLQTNVSFPYLPILSTFAEHPVSSGLEAVVMEFASPVRFVGDTSIRYTPLAFCSNLSDTVPTPAFFAMQKEWTQDDFKGRNIPVAAAIEGVFMPQGEETKMVVITDGDFIINGPPPMQHGQPSQQRQVEGDNINFISNAIDWLADDTGLNELRTKGITSRPLKEVAEGTKATIKYVNFLLPVLLAIFYGVWRARRNRSIRQQRLAENYDNTK